MLNTRFPRFCGDIGNPKSFQNVPIYQKVNKATVNSVVTTNLISTDLLNSMILAAKNLENKGVNVIGTSCGFLSPAQTEIQREISVPFLSSSLILIPSLRIIYGEDVKIGVLTFSAEKLNQHHFIDNIDKNIYIEGLDPEGKLYQCIINDRTILSEPAARADCLELAKRAVQRHPEIQVLLLECTNLSPWKNDIKRQLSLPVFDLVDALEWLDNAY